MQCDGWTCAYFCVLTVILTIISTIVFHVLFVSWFSFYYVGNYHSADLIRWREANLAKIR